MPTTITTYNTFVANTKARATEVNDNFSNYRGTLIPIEENTAAAATIGAAHQLGTSEYPWANSYINTVSSNDLLITGATTTSNVSLQNSGSTAGAFEIHIGGNTAASIGPSGIEPVNIGYSIFPANTSCSRGILAQTGHTQQTFRIDTSGTVTISASKVNFLDATVSAGTVAMRYGMFAREQFSGTDQFKFILYKVSGVAATGIGQFIVNFVGYHTTTSLDTIGSYFLCHHPHGLISTSAAQTLTSWAPITTTFSDATFDTTGQTYTVYAEIRGSAGNFTGASIQFAGAFFGEII